MADPLPRAFSVAIGDVNGDGKPGALIGRTNAVVVLLMGPDSRTWLRTALPQAKSWFTAATERVDSLNRLGSR